MLHVIRFAVGDAQCPQSLVWRLWSNGNKSDVYVAARIIADEFKASLHQSGAWRFGFSRSHIERPNPLVTTDEDRARFKWRRPAEFAPGLTLAFQVIVPHSEADEPDKQVRKPTSMAWVPPAPYGMAVHFSVIFSTPEARIRGWPGRQSMLTEFVGCIRLPTGETVWVVSNLEPITAAQASAIERYKVQARESASDLGSPREWPVPPRRIAFCGVDQDGHGYYLDVRATFV